MLRGKFIVFYTQIDPCLLGFGGEPYNGAPSLFLTLTHHMCTLSHIHTCTCTHMNVYHAHTPHIHTHYILTHTQAFTHAYKHAHMHSLTCTNMHIAAHRHTHKHQAHICHAHICIYAHCHANTHMQTVTHTVHTYRHS